MTRLGPRPLPLHMAMEGLVLQAAMAGLMPREMQPSPPGSESSNSASPPWKPVWPTPSRSNPALQVAAAALGKSPEDFTGPWSAALNPPRFLDAVVSAGQQRLEDFVRGVRAYQNHPFRRDLAPPPAVWQRGAAVLRDYGGPTEESGGVPVLFVPSLINRAYVLDLAADRSLMRAAAKDVHAFLLDWGEPGPAERAFTCTDYVDGVLLPALEDIKRSTGQTPRLVGYCMGGTLAVAAAALRPDLVSGLALLAAPWDFWAETEAPRAMMRFAQPMLEVILGAEGVASVDLLQAMFASLDPTLVGRKFRRFAALAQDSDEAQRFVALEDWLNDGVPLAAAVARECLFDWYGENTPVHTAWKIGDQVVDPGKITCPALVFMPASDRIVPPASARALAEAIPGAEQRVVDLGHIGMVAAAGAPNLVYAPLGGWLRSPTNTR